MKYFFAAPVLLLFVACGNQQPAGAAPAAQKDTAAAYKQAEALEFAFTDATGKQALLLDADSVTEAAALTAAIANDGSRVTSSFVRIQKADAQDDGRQNSHNFAHTGGGLFRLSGGAADNDASVILMNAAFTAAHQPLALQKPGSHQLEAATAAALTTAKGRNIKTLYPLVNAGGKANVYLVEFEPKGDSVLVSLAAVAGGQVVCRDYPAKFDSTSTWGVDDGGEFGMSHFNVLAAFENKGNIELVTEWAGAEGANIEYLVPNGAWFRSVKTAYRYTAPL